MTPRIERRLEAERDLIELYAYIVRDNVQAADRFLEAVEANFNRLLDMPLLGRRWESTNPRLEGVRVRPVIPFRNYLIFFRQTGFGVEILHVLHTARDLETVLEGDEPFG